MAVAVQSPTEAPSLVLEATAVRCLSSDSRFFFPPLVRFRRRRGLPAPCFDFRSVVAELLECPPKLLEQVHEASTAHSTQHAAHSTQHAAHSTQHTARSTQHAARAARSTQHTARSTPPHVTKTLSTKTTSWNRRAIRLLLVCCCGARCRMASRIRKPPLKILGRGIGRSEVPRSEDFQPCPPLQLGRPAATKV